MIPQPCTSTDPLCCDFLFEVANDILTAGMAALADCMGIDGCKGIETFVSHQEPIGATSDYLAVWLVSTEVVYDRSGRFPRARPSYSIRLVEGGFPLPQQTANGPVMPPRDDLHAAAGVSYSHGEVLLRRMMNLKEHLQCEDVQVISMTSQPIQAGFAGWTVTVRFTLPLGSPRSVGS